MCVCVCLCVRARMCAHVCVCLCMRALRWSIIVIGIMGTQLIV